MRPGTTIAMSLVASAVLFLAAACDDEDDPAVTATPSVGATVVGQLKAAFNATPLTPAMPDHLFIAAGDGSYIFLHFDRPVGQETRLLYVGSAVPGGFTKAEQERVLQQYGAGFTHFHQGACPSSSPDACHGGQGGEDGYWFRHVAVDEFDMPWGRVTPGLDGNFMPTPPPF